MSDMDVRRSAILPIVSIVVPFFGLTNSILRILKGNPKQELQWRLQVVLSLCWLQVGLGLNVEKNQLMEALPCALYYMRTLM